MMNANDLIDTYVTDVALQLPRKLRNDVAFELRALLHEELQAKAEATGREADAAMAMALLQGFGRPADVAARYLPTLTIIDPADGHKFLRATVIGLAIIWGAGLLQPIDAASGLLGALGQWWGGIVIPSLWWPGVLAVGFGIASWTRRRWPQASEWKPRAGNRIHGGRSALVLGIVGILIGLYILIEPRWLLDVFFDGRAAPAAYDALTYTETFLGRQAPWLLALIMVNIPLLATVIVKGRWSATLRRVEMGLSLAICAVMTWVVMDGPILIGSSGDRTAKFFLILITAFTLIDIAWKLRQSVKPTPNASIGNAA
jgi:hypothetical protein